ncbi:MAG: hypothetical protein ACI4O7_13105 [Aristaeellaceae bacterium]
MAVQQGNAAIRQMSKASDTIIVDGADSQAAFHSGHMLSIDQITANSNGDVFIAFVSPTFPAWSAFLDGQFPAGEASPIRLGTYIPADTSAEVSFILPGQHAIANDIPYQTVD